MDVRGYALAEVIKRAEEGGLPELQNRNGITKGIVQWRIPIVELLQSGFVIPRPRELTGVCMD